MGEKAVRLANLMIRMRGYMMKAEEINAQLRQEMMDPKDPNYWMFRSMYLQGIDAIQKEIYDLYDNPKNDHDDEIYNMIFWKKKPTMNNECLHHQLECDYEDDNYHNSFDHSFIREEIGEIHETLAILSEETEENETRLKNIENLLSTIIRTMTEKPPVSPEPANPGKSNLDPHAPENFLNLDGPVLISILSGEDKKINVREFNSIEDAMNMIFGNTDK